MPATAANLAVQATVGDQNWKIVGTGDFNGDGKSDIFWRNTSTGENAIWGAGDAANLAIKTPWATRTGRSPARATSMATARATSSGATPAPGENAIWGAGDAANLAFKTTVGDQNWKIVGTGDFDGDGKSDIFWRNTSTGENAIWGRR